MTKAECPVCAKQIMVTAAGWLRVHGSRHRPCAGSGQLPKEVDPVRPSAVEIADEHEHVAAGVREVVVVEHVRGAQPRPFADHERVDRVTIRTFDWRGDRFETVRDADEYEIAFAFDQAPANAQTPDEYRQRHFEQLAEKALRVLGLQGWWTEVERAEEIRAGGGIGVYLRPYVRSVELVGPYTVEVTAITPYCD